MILAIVVDLLMWPILFYYRAEITGWIKAQWFCVLKWFRKIAGG